MIVLMKVISRLSSCQIAELSSLFSFCLICLLCLTLIKNCSLRHFFPFGLYHCTVLILLLFLQPLWEKIEKTNKQTREWKKAQEKREKVETKKKPKERRMRGRTRKWRGKGFIHDRDYHIIVPTPTFASCVTQ